VHAKTKNALARLKTAKSLTSMLQQGLPVPRSNKAGFAPIVAMIPGENGQDQKATIRLVGRNPATMKVDVTSSLLIMVITDVEPRAPSVLIEAEAMVAEAAPAAEGNEC
jgi:hypothetical protein